jgi:hypothetical protein
LTLRRISLRGAISLGWWVASLRVLTVDVSGNNNSRRGSSIPVVGIVSGHGDTTADCVVGFCSWELWKKGKEDIFLLTFSLDLHK